MNSKTLTINDITEYFPSWDKNRYSSSKSIFVAQTRTESIYSINEIGL